MGSGGSTQQQSPSRAAQSQNGKNKKSSQNAEEGRSVRWKVMPSAEEARGKFEADGTLVRSNDAGHLELRTLLEEPMAQNYIGIFAKENQAQEAFMCWIDVQEFKSIPTDDYRRSKALHIFHKYIKSGAVLELGGIENVERDGYKEILDQSKEDAKLLTINMFDKVQQMCFFEMYENVFVRFKQSPKYVSKLYPEMRKPHL